MAEYLNRETVMKELDRNSITKKITLSDGVSIYNTIQNLPTANVVEVVKCYECKHSMFSDMYCECNYHFKIVHPADFCSYGKRRCKNGNAR